MSEQTRRELLVEGTAATFCLVLAVATTAAIAMGISMAMAGGPDCMPILVIERPVGSMDAYPSYTQRGAGDMERLTILRCDNGQLRADLEVLTLQYKKR